MNNGNLTDRNHVSKLLRYFLLTGLLALLVSCSEEADINATEDIDYNGTWVATYATEIIDSETEYHYNSSNISGIMLIQGDTLYSLIVYFNASTGVFGRADEGALYINTSYDYLDFEVVEDTALQSNPRGYYDYDKGQLTVSYLGNNALWTEIWKRASPVEASDTSFYDILY